MSTFLATLMLFALVMGGMAIGLTAGRSLKGSCGGRSGGNCPCTPEEKRACELKRHAA